MATAPPAASTDAAPAPGGKKSRKKLIIIVGVVVVLLLSLAGGGALLYMKKKKAADEAEQGSEPESAEVKVAKRDPKVKPAFAALEPFTVNLADRDADRYAQIHLSLELREEKAAELIKSFMPVIRNNVLMVLSHKTSAELLEKDGKLKLSAEIRKEIARALGLEFIEEDQPASAPKGKAKPAPEEVSPVIGVHFSNFIIQ